ncbi:MFS transporter [Nocardiopsis dassonvillei]|uniref:Major facilitator superfamily MFS_1 n=2 Tax=Nocardiopsis TaxID=2013 RepID=D7AV81_NOCDD|nr:MFS transporter [Nocardiopsis dassonvillei]ADH65742.1 major facilitator superfamily MFS_1 [Nocardiopsis dassonvillei subsp. dassonvillei DSM 43111]VEI91762.1 Arabinose efflux permease [Nocardiopsis dassonvillei]
MIRSRSSPSGNGTPSEAAPTGAADDSGTTDTTPPALPGLRGRGFALLIAATAVGLCGFAAVLPLVPLWASRGGAGEFGAGSTTAVFMLTTVLTQLAMPWLLERGGYRWAFPVGALVMGLPTPLFALTADLGPLLAVSAVRGVGFGMVSVAGTVLAARLVPHHQVGRATGYYGLAVGLPQVLILPGGVALALNIGFDTAFWLTGLCSVLGGVLAWGIWYADGGRNRAALRSTVRAAPEPGPAPDASAGRPLLRALAAPLVLMLLTASSAGAIITFLAIPLEQAAWLVGGALAAYALAVVAGRWTAGMLHDRHRRALLLLPGMVGAVAGMALVTAALWSVGDAPGTGTALLVLLGSAVFGLGFGAVQNETVTLMLNRAGPAGYGRASAVWNIGYDAGSGAGAMVLGLLIQLTGYGPAFAVTAVALLASVPLALGGRAGRGARARG